MKTQKYLVVTAIAVFTFFSITTASGAENTTSGKKITISVTAEDGTVWKFSGTKTQVERALRKLNSEAAVLAARAATVDPCRVTVCINKTVNLATGITTEIPMTEAEIVLREANTLALANKNIELAALARTKYLGEGASDVLGIPINVNGTSMTITGTAAEIASQVSELQRRAVEAEAAIEADPCAVGGCTKTIVDLHWGNAPATTTVLPLSGEDLAQRATDRSAAATRARAIADAAAGSSPEPIIAISVQTPNQGFGTSGTRSQLETTVRELESRAAQAAASAAAGCTGCFDRVVDLHWGLAPATTTDIPFSPERIAQHAADAAANAASAAALATAAREALNNVP